MASRDRSHFSAMSSAAWNWLTGWSPYRDCHPVEPENGSSNPYSRPASIALLIGIALMFWTPPATTKSAVPERTAWAAKWTACCDDPHCRSTVVPGTSSGSPAASQDVRAMLPACGADRVDAAEDHVVHGGGIDAGPMHQTVEYVGAEIGRMNAREPSPAPSDRCTYGVNDVRLGHGASLRLGSVEILCAKRLLG